MHSLLDSAEPMEDYSRYSVTLLFSSGPIPRFSNFLPKMVPGRNFLYYAAICRIPQISLVPRELQLVGLTKKRELLELWVSRDW